MTNYERLFREQMQNPEFAIAYHVAKLERKLGEMLDDLKEKIDRNTLKRVCWKPSTQFNIKYNYS